MPAFMRVPIAIMPINKNGKMPRHTRANFQPMKKATKKPMRLIVMLYTI